MRNLLNNFIYKFRTFMQGRYGFDDFSKKMSVLSVVLFVIFLFTRLRLIYTLAVILLLYAYFRCFSRNYVARQKELTAYLKYSKKIQNIFSVRKKMWKERKTHKYFRCKCGAYLRVPKGKGKIEITCNVCKNKMIKKS